MTLSEQIVRTDIGSNGQSLAISPDGTHVAYACGSGNGSYDIWDFHPEDLESRGEWNTGAYPRAATFSRDSTTVAATNGYMLQLYSVATHQSLGEWTPPLSGCDYDQLRTIALSPEADILFAYAHCGFESDRGQLVWLDDAGALSPPGSARSSFGYGPRLLPAGRVQLALFPLGGYLRVAAPSGRAIAVDISRRCCASWSSARRPLTSRTCRRCSARRRIRNCRGLLGDIASLWRDVESDCWRGRAEKRSDAERLGLVRQPDVEPVWKGSPSVERRGQIGAWRASPSTWGICPI